MRKVLHKVKSQWVVLGVMGATVVSLGTANIQKVSAAETENTGTIETIELTGSTVVPDEPITISTEETTVEEIPYTTGETIAEGENDLTAQMIDVSSINISKTNDTTGALSNTGILVTEAYAEQTLNQEITVAVTDYLYTVNNGEATITGYKGLGGDIIIPTEISDGVNVYTVSSIGDRVFSSRYDLTSVTIPDSVTSIGSSAFEYCIYLTSVTMGNGVLSIGERAFNNCSNLMSVTIPNSMTSIGPNAFSFCSSLKEVSIPDTVTNIGNWAFNNCNNLTNVIIGNGVTSIDRGVFSYCSNLTNIIIGNGVKNIGSDAFQGCYGLINVTIPDTVTNIGEYAFSYCKNLTSVTIPDSVTHIGNMAFYNCNNLTNVIIGSGVTNIGDNAFYNCSSLDTITANPLTAPVTTSTTFMNVPLSVALYTQAGATGYDVAPWAQLKIIEKVMTGITITTPPTKIDYIEGQSFDSTGMVVLASYDNGTTVDVSKEVSVLTGILSITDKVVTISYEGKTTTQIITVAEKNLITVNLVPEGTLSSSVSFDNSAFATDKLTDDTANYARGTSGLQWVQVDLGAAYDLNEIQLWHYYGDGRSYRDVVVQLSNDASFASGTVTVFNNDKDGSASLGVGTDSEYRETSAGKTIAFDTVNARYARFYSNGSTVNGANHYVEIEVYGVEPQAVPTTNLASEGTLSSSVPFDNNSFATDKLTDDTADYARGTSGLQWVQVDLGAAYDLNEIQLWHYYGDGRSYHDVVVQLSNDASFSTGAVTIFNNDKDGNAGLGVGTDSEYSETSAGKTITFDTTNARYARFYSNGSTVNGANHYVEIQVYGIEPQIAPTVNLAPEGTISSSVPFDNNSFAIDKLTDDTADYARGTSGLQWVQVDLGASYDLNEIQLWHYYGDGRTYHDVVVQLSNDVSFSNGAVTVFNNDKDGSTGLGVGTDSEYSETSAGKTIRFAAVNARYARFYSNGSTVNGANHYVEIEIYGVEPQTVPTMNLVPEGALSSSVPFDNSSFATDKMTDDTADYARGTSGLQWVQVDLGASYDLKEIQLWHYYGDGRSYHDVVVQLSNDANFASGTVTVFNNDSNGSAGLGVGTDSEYSETSAGKTISFDTVNARYARFYSNGSTVNGANHYVEIEVYGVEPKILPTVNLAPEGTLSSSVPFDNSSFATDAQADSTADYARGTSGLQWVQLDLGASSDLNKIQLWHYFGDGRSYRDVVVQLSNDETFSNGAITVFNNDKDGSAGLGVGTDNEYSETSAGKTINFDTVNARYVRFYSNGSTVNGANHYVEIEVYGLEPQIV